jgi:hypothetical protein
MPLYSFRCLCGKRDTRFAKVEARNSPQFCSCGASMTRVLDAPAVRPEITPYLSPVTGLPISSRAQRTEDLKRSGSIEWDPGMRADCERRQADELETTYRTVDASIDKTVAEMHASNLL